jgi:hypothetical protein
MTIIPASLILIICFSAGLGASELEGDNFNYSIASTDSSFAIDGELKEEAWQQALKLPLNYEVSPGDNIAPQVRTEVYLTHTPTNLYIAFVCFDPDPASIRARLSDRDSIYGDDTVSIMLDTFNDEMRAFEFSCNPLGIQRDTLKNDASSGRGMRYGRGDTSWDVIWDSAGKVTEFGYVVEMAIPFNALSFPKIDGDHTWGFRASRDYPRDINYSIRSVPADRDRNCDICQSAKIIGLRGITPGRNIEINPTVTGVYSQERVDFPDGDFELMDQNADVGISGRWGVTPNINLSAAVNPDFSQIEADAYQLDLNQRFALRYNEKRPFFLEGRDFFTTPLNAVYTRAVANPNWGMKMTGKQGSNAFGVFMAEDEYTSLILPGREGSSSASYDWKSNATVMRYRKDILDNSTIGVLMTDRQGGNGYYSRLFGGDGQIRISSQDTFTFNVLGSSTQYSEEMVNDYDVQSDPISGMAYDLRFRHATRSWNFSASHSRLDDDFRADLGFISRVGTVKSSAEYGRTWYGDSKDLIQRVFLNTSVSETKDVDGNLFERGGRVTFWASGVKQSSLMYTLSYKNSIYEELSGNFTSHNMRASFRPTANTHISLRGDYGGDFDYSNLRLGTKFSLAPEFNISLGEHLKVKLTHSYRTLDVDMGRLYTSNVTQSNIIYQFNSRTFFRSILQYVNNESDQDLYTSEVTEQYSKLFTQLLFSYKVNPRTVLFLGYSDNHRGYVDIRMTQSDRAIFAKIGYAWVL